MSPLQEESGCEEDEGEEEEEGREEDGFDSDESLVDSDSDSDEKGVFLTTAFTPCNILRLSTYMESISDLFPPNCSQLPGGPGRSYL